MITNLRKGQISGKLNLNLIQVLPVNSNEIKKIDS